MKPYLIVASILGSVALAGCGVNGQLRATPTGHGTDHISGTVHTPPVPSSVSPASSPPSQTDTAPTKTSPVPSSQISRSSPSPQQVARVSVTADPPSVTPGENTTISGTVWLPNGQGTPGATITIMGLPHEPTGDTVKTNAAGQFAVTAAWSQPGTYQVSAGNGLVGSQTHVVVSASGASPDTPGFAGQEVQLDTAKHTPPAIPNGFQSPPGQQLTFSASRYHRVEGFTGRLHGHSFVLDFYQEPHVGLFVGVQYQGHPRYFGYGPSPVFRVINFTQNTVILGNSAAGTYMALNLLNGQQTTHPSQVVPLKGYSGLTGPAYILGLPGTHYPTTIPYGSAN